MNCQSKKLPIKSWNLYNQILYNAMYDSNPTKSLAYGNKAIAKFYIGRPLWLYISDDFSLDDTRKFIHECQNLHSLNLAEMSGVITSHRAAQICQEFMPAAASWELTAMCIKQKPTHNPHNKLVVPTAENLPTISRWLKSFYQEGLLQNILEENSSNMAKALIKGKKLYCLTPKIPETTPKTISVEKTAQNTTIQTKIQTKIKAETKEIKAMIMQTPLPNKISRLNLIYVPPESRGNGFAKDIISLLVNNLQQQGNLPVLYVRTANVPAVRLYESLGFVEVGKLTELRFAH
ncbi:MAG: GNAT family N-acetyltransferase [Defluviitaleaceae bacterium]|nr:GNAT family N-acetyltransferase [Defluviitaleaceae bacterium]